MPRKVFLVLLLIFSSFWSQAQNLDVLLPQKTILYVSIPTGKEWRQQYHRSALGQFLQEAEIQQLGTKIFQRFDFAFEEMNQQLQHFCGKNFSEILALFDGEIGFAITQIYSELPEMIGSIGFTSASEGQAFLNNFLSQLPSLENRKNEKGVWFKIVLEGMPLFFGWRGNTLFLSFQENRLIELLFENPPQNALTQHPTYQEFSQILGEKKAFRFWMNLQEFWQQGLVQQTTPAESQESLHTLGIDQWLSLGLACCFDQLDFKWTYHIGTDGTPPRGLNLFLNPPPLPPAVLQKLPQSLSSLSTFQFDSLAFYQLTKTLFLQSSPDFWEMIQGYLSTFEQSIQMSIEEILSMSGSVFSTVSFEDDFGEQTVYCFFPENPQVWTQKTLQLFQGQLELLQKDYRGKTIYQLRVPLGNIEKGLGNIFPTNIIQALKEVFAYPTSFYVDDDRIVSAHLPQILMDFIDAVEVKGYLPPQIARVASSDLASISWTPVGKRSFASCLSFLEICNLFIPAIRVWAQIDISSFDLPRAELLLKYARPSFSYSRTGRNILSVSQVNVIPTRLFELGPTTVIVGTGVVAAIAIPGFLRARLSANETTAIGTLKSIATAQTIFQVSTHTDQDNDGSGEYGWLQELAGTIPCRGSSDHFSPLIASEFGETALKNGGIAEKNGYYFILYLPTAQGNAARETSKILNQPENADAQETRWICYAWPVNFGSSGNRTFMVNQTGQIYSSINSSYSGLYVIPAPNAALEAGEGSENLETQCSGLGVDGNYWSLND